jgi:hypothetical protein
MGLSAHKRPASESRGHGRYTYKKSGNFFMLAFFAGIIAGYLLAIATGLAIVHRPLPERKAPPVRYGAIGAGRAVDTGRYGKFPGDWDGAIWSPPGSEHRR